jgi:hypothetical protein
MEDSAFVFLIPIVVLIVGSWYIHKQSKGNKSD